MSYIVARREFDQACIRVASANDAMAEYLKAADTFGDEYQDLRNERANALDKLDYLTAAYRVARAAQLSRHTTLEKGDRITLLGDRAGTVHARGSLAGWVILDGDDKPSRFEAIDVVSVERAS